MKNYIYRHETGIYYTSEARDLYILNGGRGSFTAVHVRDAVHRIRSVFHIRTTEDILQILKQKPNVSLKVADK